MNDFWWGVLVGAGVAGLPLLIIIGYGLWALSHAFDG